MYIVYKVMYRWRITPCCWMKPGNEINELILIEPGYIGQH